MFWPTCKITTGCSWLPFSLFAGNKHKGNKLGTMGHHHKHRASLWRHCICFPKVVYVPLHLHRVVMGSIQVLCLPARSLRVCSQTHRPSPCNSEQREQVYQKALLHAPGCPTPPRTTVAQWAGNPRRLLPACQNQPAHTAYIGRFYLRLLFQV